MTASVELLSFLSEKCFSSEQQHISVFLVRKKKEELKCQNVSKQPDNAGAGWAQPFFLGPMRMWNRQT